MSNEIFNQMLSAYDLATHQQKRNATFEVNQQIILAGLYNGGFFNEAAFYGGTCLRIFHGLQRFSEDMDFSLLAPSQDFDFTQYFQPIVDQFAMVGREVEIKKKDKKNFCKVESAFLKDNTDVYDITFQTEKSIDKNRSGHAAATEVPHRAETTSAPTILHDSLLHPSRPLCRQDARLGLSSLEEPRQGS